MRKASDRGTGQMPPLATSIPDAAAVQMLREWVEGVKPPAGEPKTGEKAATRGDAGAGARRR